MSLEPTQATLQPEQAAHTIVALAGRFAHPVRRAPTGVRIHLIHGDSDGVVLPKWSLEADKQLRALGTPVTLDLLPSLGHGIDDRSLQHVVRHLAQVEHV